MEPKVRKLCITQGFTLGVKGLNKNKLQCIPALGNWGGADTLRPPLTADFGETPAGVVAFRRGLLPFSRI